MPEIDPRVDGLQEIWVCCPVCEVESRMISDERHSLCPNCNALLEVITPPPETED